MRAYQQMVSGTLETPIGTMDYAITSNDHVSLTSGSSYDGFKGLTYRGQEYHVHIHLHLVDGVWGSRERHDAYMDHKTKRDGITATGRAKILEEVTAAWNNFIADKGNLLADAEKRRISNAIMQAESNVNATKKAYDEATAELNKLIKAEQTLQSTD